MSERMKRIGVVDRGVIVRRQKSGPKSSVYGDNVKRYGLGQHPTEEEKKTIALEDTGKFSVSTEAGLGGKRFAKGERAPKVPAKKTEDVDKTQSINEIAGLGGKRSVAGEKISKDVPPEVEEKTADLEESESEKTEKEIALEIDDEDSDNEESGGEAEISPIAEIPPHPEEVLKDFFESLTVAKLKEFAVLNNLDYGDVRLKAEYIEAACKSAEEKLPNTILGRTPDINPSDYIIYLFEGCGLKIDEKWLPKTD